MTGNGSRRTRSRKDSPAKPRDWAEVNQQLACLGEIERQIRALRDQFEQKMAVLKQQWLEASQPVERERERLQKQVEQFYWEHREELSAQRRKSLELPFGRLGSHIRRTVLVENDAAAQQWLAARGLDRFLRTRTEVDRSAIRSALLPSSGSKDEESRILLSCPVIRLCEMEQFWCQVSQNSLSIGPHAYRGNVTSNDNRSVRYDEHFENACRAAAVGRQS